MVKNKTLVIVFIFIFFGMVLMACSAISSSIPAQYAIPTNPQAATMTQVAKEATQSALELKSSEAKATAQEIDAQRTQIAADLAKERREMTQVVLSVTQTAEYVRVKATEDAISAERYATQAASAKETERVWAVYSAQMTETAEDAKQTEAVSNAIATSTAVWSATQDAIYVDQQSALAKAQIAEAEAQKQRIELAVERQRAINEFSAYIPLVIIAVVLIFIGFIAITYMNNAKSQVVYDADGNLTAIVRRDGKKLQLIQPGRAVQPVIIVDGSDIKSPMLSDTISQIATTGRDQMLSTIRSAGNAENALPAGIYKSVISETNRPIDGEIIENKLLDGGQTIKIVEARQLRAWLTDVNKQLVEEVIDADTTFIDDEESDAS